MKLFWGLQLADVVTTLVFLSMGIAESNPLASWLIAHFGPWLGLLILKSSAILIAFLCNCAAHPKFIRRINMAYMAFVSLNVLTILNAVRH